MRRLLVVVAILISSCGDDFAGVIGEPQTAFTETQMHNLEVINRYRAEAHLVTLRIDATLSTFAEAGSAQLANDHRPHGHFVDAGPAKWSRGFRGAAAENQGDEWPALDSDGVTNQRLQIDAMMKVMFDQGPGEGHGHGHYENMMDPRFRRMGIGILTIRGVTYLTNDFSE